MLASLLACAPSGSSSTAEPEAPTLVIEPTSVELPTEGRRTEHRQPKPCSVTTEDFAATRQAWPLVLADGETEWARLEPRDGGQATAHLRNGHDPALRYDFVGDGLELTGQVAREAVHFYSGKPVWFEGVVLARPRHVFDVAKADASVVELELELGEDFVPSRISQEVDCAWLQLVPGTFDEKLNIGSGTARAIVGDEPVPLFAQPRGGRSRLAIALGDGTQITAGKLHGTRQRIYLFRRQFHVLAWVPRNRLRTPKVVHGSGMTGGSGVGRGHRGNFGALPRRFYRCASGIPLYVELDDRREPVGRVLPGRIFWVQLVVPPQDGFQKIHVDDGPMELSQGATLSVPEAELRRCSPTKP
jgi:hypothetical protein